MAAEKVVQSQTQKFVQSGSITLAKRTQKMIDTLGESDVQKVFSFTASLMEEDDNPFRPVTKEQVLKDIIVSKEEFEAGKGQDAKQALNEIRAEFGI